MISRSEEGSRRVDRFHTNCRSLMSCRRIRSRGTDIRFVLLYLLVFCLSSSVDLDGGTFLGRPFGESSYIRIQSNRLRYSVPIG